MVKHYAYCLSMSRGGFPDQAETNCESHPPPAFGKWRLTNEKRPGSSRGVSKCISRRRSSSWAGVA